MTLRIMWFPPCFPTFVPAVYSGRTPINSSSTDIRKCRQKHVPPRARGQWTHTEPTLLFLEIARGRDNSAGAAHSRTRERQRATLARSSQRVEPPDFGERRPLFLQAEDGIRNLTVTGVQTCALPI